MMAIGLVLTTWLTSVDPEHHGGWSGDLNACEAEPMLGKCMEPLDHFTMKHYPEREVLHVF